MQDNPEQEEGRRRAASPAHIMKKHFFGKHARKDLPLHMMMLPGVILIAIFSYGPMFGLVMAFQRFSPQKGFFHSEWVGLENFRYVLNLPNFWQVIGNTLFISVFKIIGSIVVPVVVTLLLNELLGIKLKRTLQTIIYFPHFLSWIILGGILIDILSPSEGIFGSAAAALGIKPVYFLGDKNWFPITMIISEIWKEFGYGTVVYFAALAGIDPVLYEAAQIDGAGRWKQAIHITLPGLYPTIFLMAVLALGTILNAGTNGFEQIFNLYSPQVYETGDILDTLVYRLGLGSAQFSVATAIGLFKSLISFVLMTGGYWLVKRTSGYEVL